jgi:hypothetical protein
VSRSEAPRAETNVIARSDDRATPHANRRHPIRTIGRTMVRPYIRCRRSVVVARSSLLGRRCSVVVARSSMLGRRCSVVDAGDYVRAKLRCAPFFAHIHRPYSARRSQPTPLDVHILLRLTSTFYSARRPHSTPLDVHILLRSTSTFYSARRPQP